MRIIIVGGVAGGASAATRARRLSEDAEIILLERGDYVSFANCGLPYHIGGAIQKREALIVQSPESLYARYRIDVRVKSEVLRINRPQKTVLVKDLSTGTEKVEPYDFLILSPGAEPIRPPLPGINLEEVRTLRNISDMDRIKSVIDKNSVQDVVIVGGGYIGLEMAEACRERNLNVTIVELAGQVMGPADPEMAAFLHQELTNHGVELRLGVSVKGFQKESRKLRVELNDGKSLFGDLAILAIGVKPETWLAQESGLEIGARGGIAVNEHMRTSDEFIYATGDAIEVDEFVTGSKALIPLAGPANRQGRIAADNIFGRKSVYKKTQGTAICKVFDLTIGMTGTNEKILKRLNVPYEKIYVHANNHASYFPDAVPISMKLIFDPQCGTILGAQAVGRDGVDKRIDVLAVALRAGLTVFDLEHLELSYAPPYGSAKDPVNFAGFVAANTIRGDVTICHASEIVNSASGVVVLDVRGPDEFKEGAIPGAVHIPLDQLRKALGGLDPAKEYVVYCEVGLRGYVACRIMSQRGFKCRNLSGGYRMFQAATDTLKPGAVKG